MDEVKQLDLHQAFLAWQERMPRIDKTRAGHKYKYVGLSELLSACLPVLTELGFELYHETDSGADGRTLRVTCYLRHGPDDCRTSSLGLPLEEVVRGSQGMNVAQAMGSFITYARRYTVLSVLGITDGVDTDASDLHAPAAPADPPPVAGPWDAECAEWESRIGDADTLEKSRKLWSAAVKELTGKLTKHGAEWSAYHGRLITAGRQCKLRIENEGEVPW